MLYVICIVIENRIKIKQQTRDARKQILDSEHSKTFQRSVNIYVAIVEADSS